MGFDLESLSKTENLSRRPNQAQESIWQKEVTFFGSRFSDKRKESFYVELGVLLKAGITLKEGLELIKEGEKKEKIKRFFDNLLGGLINGKSLSETIQEMGEFSEYEFHSIRIGEESGNLDEIIAELGLFFAKRNEQRRNLINALTYPIIILITAVMVVVFMLRLVVPMFQDIFKQNDVELPWITEWVVTASEFLKSYGWWALIFIIVVISTRKILFKNDTFKKYRDQIVLKIPYVGSFLRTVYLAQFTRALSLLTASKVPLLNSLELASKMINFSPLRNALVQTNEKIMQGKSLSESLAGNKIFDSKMISLVKVAEETNQTEFIFNRLNEQYSIEVQQKSKLLSTLLEPLIILFVGALVGVILIAMYLPMFKLGSILG